MHCFGKRLYQIVSTVAKCAPGTFPHTQGVLRIQSASSANPTIPHPLQLTIFVGGCEPTTDKDAASSSSMLIVETIHLGPRQIQFDRLILRRPALPRLCPGQYLPLDHEFVSPPRTTPGVECRRRPQGVIRALQARGRRRGLRWQGRRRRQRVPRGVDRADAGVDYHVISIAVRDCGARDRCALFLERK